MELGQIKELMRGGDVAAAAEELKALISAEPGNQEAKILYGTCCHICGDDATLVRIDEEVAQDPDFNHKRIYRKYHAMRVAACGLAAFALAATVTPATVSAGSPDSELYGGYTLYGAPAPLYGATVMYGTFISETEDVKISFQSGGGVLHDAAGNVVGSLLLKVGKQNAKTGKAKISGTVTMLDGTRKSISPKTVSMPSNGVVATSVEVKGLGTANIEIKGGGFHGDLNGYEMVSAEVGGPWDRAAATVSVDVDDLSMFSGEVQEDLLPNCVEATVSRGKWVFSKAASVKFAKPKGGTEKQLVVNTKAGSNLSGLKLTYTPSKGTFKGSFNIYEIQTAGGKKTLKKRSVKVSGLVVDGVGYGIATLKGPAASWTVRVE